MRWLERLIRKIQNRRWDRLDEKIKRWQRERLEE